MMGSPVGTISIFLLTDFGKGSAFPAVKVNGLLISINPLIFLVLIFSTAGATRHSMSRGSCLPNALSHDARKASSSSLSPSSLSLLLAIRRLLSLRSLRGTCGAIGAVALRLRAGAVSFAATALPRIVFVRFAGGTIATAKLSSASLLTAELESSSSSTSVSSRSSLLSSSLLVRRASL